MDRRTLLSSTGALLGAALAGCLSDSPPADEDDSPTSTASPTPTPASTLADTTFSVENVGPGGGENEASVSFDDGVAIDGTIRGKSGCYTASLGSTTYEDASLTLVVESHEKEGSDACTQAIVDVEYAATFTFEGPLPDTVVVEHDVDGSKTTVAEATP
jgi:hypothetical protein